MTNYGSTGTAITHKDAGSSNLSTTVPYRYTPYSGTNYGFLYNWPGATGYSVNNSPATTGAANMGTSSGKNQGACPRGWHIPTYSEMSTLNGLLDNVTNKNNFIGNDAYAYKYPGYIAASTGSYTASGNIVRFWTSTATGSYHYQLYYNVGGSHGFETTRSDAAAVSVRCLRDF